MTFRDWLAGEMQRQGLSRREVARRLAVHHPKGVTPDTVETFRRAVRRYLDPVDPQRPNPTTRLAFADALEADPADVPTAEDEAEDVTDLADLMRQQAALNRQLKRALKERQLA